MAIFKHTKNKENSIVNPYYNHPTSILTSVFLLFFFTYSTPCFFLSNILKQILDVKFHSLKIQYLNFSAITLVCILIKYL